MALLQSGRDFRLQEVNLRDKPSAMLALSPKATVPVLHLANGRVLDESWDIMRWAWSDDDGDGWWSRSLSAKNLHFLACNDGEFKQYLDRYKYPGRYPNEPCEGDVFRSLALSALLLPLERTLQGQRFLGGATPCATDLAIFPFVRQFAAVEPDWFAAQDIAAVQAWLRGWLRNRMFDLCMTKLQSAGSALFPRGVVC